MRNSIIAFALLATVGGSATGQSSAADITAGDREYRAMRAESALEHYERALATEPDNFEALWKASRSALELDPGDAEGHFALARALGKSSQAVGVRDKVRYATTIRKNALECIRLNPGHSGCHHVMGVWNAEVMRLGGFERMIARNFLGGRALRSASWPAAQRFARCPRSRL